MDKLKSRLQLLSLISLFLIYRAISSLISGNLPEFLLWISFTVVYLISLMILYFIFKKTSSQS